MLRLVGSSSPSTRLSKAWSRWRPTHLDDVTVFDFDPTADIKTIRTLFECLRKHDLKLSPSKALPGATDVGFLRDSISSSGLCPKAEKVSAGLVKKFMPRDLKQVLYVMGGVGHYRKSLCDLSERIRPTTSFLRKEIKLAFTPAIKAIERGIFAELTPPPILVFPNWDAVADGFCPLHVLFEAIFDGAGDVLEQK